MTDQFVERRIVPEPTESGWHLDKKVPLSLIFAMLLQAGMGIWAIADIKKDVELLKAETTVLHHRDTQQSVDTREGLRGLQEQFQRMDSKLDRLIERTNK